MAFQQQVSEDNVYQFLLYFDQLNDQFNDGEKKEFLSTGNKATICMVTGMEWNALKATLQQIFAEFRGRHFTIPDDALEQFKVEDIPFFGRL